MAKPKGWTNLWATYQKNRLWAGGFAGKINKCAIVMSATLGVKPQSGDATLAHKDLVGQLHKSVQKATWLKDYFIRAQELANCLQKKWGAPHVRADRTAAAKQMKGRYGVVFFEDAYAGGIDHIDLFNGSEIACRLSPDGQLLLSGDSDPFRTAKKIWFWELA